MAPTAIPLAKQVLRGLRAQDAARVAARALRARTAAEVEQLLVDFLASASRSSQTERRRVRMLIEGGTCAEQVTRVDKPWGYELHWAKTDRYVGKLIHINAGHALSLQYHNQKDETIFLGRAGCCSRSRKATSWSSAR